MRRFYRFFFLFCLCLSIVALGYASWLKNQYSEARYQLNGSPNSPSPQTKTVCVESGSPPSQTCIVKTLEIPDDRGKESDRLTQQEVADWTFGTFLVSIVGAMSGLLGLFWIRQTLLAANRANEISREAFITGERPWIFTEIEADFEADLDEHDIWSLDITIVNKNYGKSVALRVHSNIASCPLGKQKEAIEKLCTVSREQVFDDGILLAPGETFRRPWKWTYDPEEWVGKLKDYEPVARMIVGCVTYETPFNDGLHQTAFAYVIDAGKLAKWSGGFAS